MDNPKASIDKVRSQIIHELYFLILTLAVLMSCLRLVQGKFLHLSLNLTLVLIILLSLHFFKNKSQLLLDIIVVSLLGLTLFFPNDGTVISIIVYLSLIPAISTALYTANWKRYAVCFFSIAIFTYIFFDQVQTFYTFYLLTIVGFYISLKFTELLESQQNNLSLAFTEKEKLTKKLENKNKELITFAHIMSHDLKSPLRTIKSFSGLIRRRIKFEDETQEEYFEFIEQSAESMSKMIDDLLLYYKVDSEINSNEEINLNDLLQSIETSYKYDLTNENLELNIDLLPVINGDRSLLRTLFQNLITNSIKYQPLNQSNHVPQVNIKHQSTNEKINILISDNGIGIQEEYLDKLFSPFTRFHSKTDYTGSGLGMSICNRVMLKHKGSIEVVETSSQGTTFKLSFPKK